MGASPRVLDLFAGCGGLSLGFHAAGFSIVGGLEIDPTAAQTYAINFHAEHGPKAIELHAAPRDITQVSCEDLADEFGLDGELDEHFDVIVGGPPCQAFARVGRAKLREVAAHPEAFLNDPRGDLYLRYLQYVAELRPLALVMENVPDVINYGGHNIAHEVCEALEELGYVARYSLLNAAFFGVPQMRERMFLVALDSDLGVEPSFPAPTHWIELPRGYEGSRQVALKHLAEDDAYYEPPPTARKSLPPAITSEAALRDLPALTAHLEGNDRRGKRNFDVLHPYRSDIQPSSYARTMRNWKGFESTVGVRDHVIRYLPRDYQIFARMKPGDQYPEAHAVALEIFSEKLDLLKRRGDHVPAGSPAWSALRQSIVPPYDPGKFPNKWRKLEADAPARTLMAHIGKDTYSHIHYDSSQARTISVREAARLQSFPDGFLFSGAMNAAFRQIGNAVPPLLAYALAKDIADRLTAGSVDA